VLLAATKAPSRRIMRWPATGDAATAVEGLIRHWDDLVADDIFAGNVDLDLPRADRIADVAAAAAQLGTIESSTIDQAVSTTPADMQWWLRGSGGRLRIEIALTPEARPRVQTLDLRFVAHPSPRLAAAVAGIVAGLSATPPAWPAAVALADGVDVTGVVGWSTWLASDPARAAWQLDPDPTKAESADAATFVIAVGDDQWHLVVAVDGTGAVSACSVAAVARHADRWVETQWMS